MFGVFLERAGEVEIGLIDIYGLYCENAVVNTHVVDIGKY